MDTEQTTPQPLDVLMTRLGITNADLVKASTEQLSFKMVQKGRTGRRITPNIQDKILNALVKIKPDLQTRRRDLFRYELNEEAVTIIHEALVLSDQKKIKYPQFVDMLVAAGINRYAVDVVTGQMTFYAAAGEAHVIAGTVAVEGSAGFYHEPGFRSAIVDSQKGLIDHSTFLKRIYQAGITSYEANVRERRIVYRGLEQSFREDISLTAAEPEPIAVAEPLPVSIAEEKKTIAKKPRVKKAVGKKQAASKIVPKKRTAKKKKKPGVVRVTRKARMTIRKLYFKKKRKGRSRSK